MRPATATTATTATTAAVYQAILPRPLPSHVPVQEHHPAANLPERPITDTGADNLNVDDVNPTPTPPGLAGRAAASRTVQPLDLGPMNILCDYCEARHWVDERVPSSRSDQPSFESCCKRGDVVLPRFNPPPGFLQGLLQDNTTAARRFRQQLRAYNAALSFTSLNCTVTDRGASSGISCF